MSGASGALAAPELEFQSTLTSAEDFGSAMTRLTREGWQAGGPIFQEKLGDGSYRYLIVSVRQIQPEPSPLIKPLGPGELRLVNMN